MASKSGAVSKDDFEYGQVLGEGAFGQVRLCVHKETEIQYAAKILKKDQLIKEKKTKYVKSEKEILLELDHPNVSKLYYTFSDEKRLFFILELITGGELLEKIAKMNYNTGELKKVVQFYMAELLDALIYIHSKNVCHRDIKPENIMLNGEGHVKLIDFGISKRIERPSINTFCGTAEYLAPEVVCTNEYGTKVDWWAFGCIIYEIFTGKSPFHSNSMAVTCQKIVDRDIYWPKTLPSDAKDLINGLLTVDPDKRLCGESARNHKFFNGIDWNSLWKKRPPIVPDELMNDEDKQFGLNMSVFDPSNEKEEDVMAHSHVFKVRVKTSAIEAIKRSQTLRKIYPILNKLPERPRPINSRIVDRSLLVPQPLGKVDEEEVDDTMKNRRDLILEENSENFRMSPINAVATLKSPVQVMDFGREEKVATISNFQLKLFDMKIDSDSNVVFDCLKSISTGSSCNYLQFSPNGNMLAFDMQRHIGLIDLTKDLKKKPKYLVGHPLPITLISWHNSSGLLAGGGNDNSVYLWSLTGSKPRLRSQFEAHSACISSLNFHPKSNLLISGSGDSKLMVYDSESCRVVQKCSNHEDAILGVNWHPLNDNIFCSWSLDRRLIFTDIKSSYKPIKIFIHSKPIINAEWSPNGKYLATCSKDTIRIWSFPELKCIFQYSNAELLPGELLSFDKDSRYLALLKSREDCFPSIIDLQKCSFLQPPDKRGHVLPVTSLRWSNSKPVLTTGSFDKTVVVWGLDDYWEWFAHD
ncbi:hypothetical protein ABK040_010266 [Willaertia magna]